MAPGAALMINTGPDEFVIAGEGVTVSFLPDSKGPQQVELEWVEEGMFRDGVWAAGRRLNGDETNGDAVILRGTVPEIVKVKVYRHE
jgi:hypothetical protein